jgi:truncated hemoglobin YjbI
MDGGCAEVESEGVDVKELRARTKAEAAGSEARADDLVEKFLTRVANAQIVSA